MKNLNLYGPFPAAVFLGAFLLFQIQPLLGKYFLPWFGGAPAVWMTCLMFFQLLLLGGYAYAHALQKLPARRQAAVHTVLLALTLGTGAVLSLVWKSPVLPGPALRPDGTGSPVAGILRLLLISIGPAYFLLSSSASLLQAWFHRTGSGASPYKFYVISNAASLLALLSYPFLVEPLLPVRAQALAWSGGFAVYAALCIRCAGRLRNAPPRSAAPAAQAAPAVPFSVKALWTLLAFCGGLALMSVTSQMTQDVPPVPFLWILPLSLYLLSYIIGFLEGQRRWQDVYIYLLLCAFGAAWHLMHAGLEAGFAQQIAAYSFILLAVCLFCHNALYRTRPDPERLTSFYLCISLGGALGGLFTVLAAPVLFNGCWEYQLMLVLAGALAVFSIYSDAQAGRVFRPIRHLFPLLLAGFAAYLGLDIARQMRTSVFMDRNFFGAIRVSIEYNNGIPIHTLMHGRINHGMQIDHPRLRLRPTTYFTDDSGAGRALRLKQEQKETLHVGVLGLGIGTLAAYGREGDVYRMYEIDPAVIRLAENSPWFSYLRDSKARIITVPGDGRLALERDVPPSSGGTEDGAMPPFDVLILDAFTGDSPPAHLLTLEAFELYLDRLAGDGVIAVNISNRYLDLLPVLEQVRRRFGLEMAHIQSPGDMKISANAQWVLLTRDPQFLRQPAVAQADSLRGRSVRQIRPWTDDYSNLLSVIK